MNYSSLSVALIALGGIAAAPAAAAEPQRLPPQLEAALACRAETDDARRLACYDRAVGGLAEATAKGDVKVLDREEVRRTKRSLFGFSLPKLPFFGNDGDGDKAGKASGKDGDATADSDEQIEATAAAVSSEGYGRWTITLDDGAVWRVTEKPRRDPKPGSKITIRRATMGGYFLKIDGGTAVRALRVG